MCPEAQNLAIMEGKAEWPTPWLDVQLFIC